MCTTTYTVSIKSQDWMLGDGGQPVKRKAASVSFDSGTETWGSEHEYHAVCVMELVDRTLRALAVDERGRFPSVLVFKAIVGRLITAIETPEDFGGFLSENLEDELFTILQKVDNHLDKSFIADGPDGINSPNCDYHGCTSQSEKDVI